MADVLKQQLQVLRTKLDGIPALAKAEVRPLYLLEGH